MTLDDLILKPLANNPRKISIARVAAIFTLIFAILVISTEGIMVYDPQYTLMYQVRPSFIYMYVQIIQKHPQYVTITFGFTLLYMSGITLVCFFTIFNLRLSDYL